MSKPQILQDRPQPIFASAPPFTSTPEQPGARAKSIKKPRLEALQKAKAKAEAAKKAEAKAKVAKPKKAQTKRKAKPKKIGAVIYTFDEIPMAHALVSMYGLAPDWLTKHGYISLNKDIDIFERIPEPPTDEELIQERFSLQRILHEILMPALGSLGMHIESAYKYGYHDVASAEEISESFSRVSYRTLLLADVFAARSEALDGYLTDLLKQFLAEGIAPHEMLARFAEETPEEPIDIFAGRYNRFCALLNQRGIDPLEAMVHFPKDATHDYGKDGWIYLAHALMKDDRLLDLAMAEKALRRHRLNHLLSNIQSVATEAKSLQKRLRQVASQEEIRPSISAGLARQLGIKPKPKAAKKPKRARNRQE